MRFLFRVDGNAAMGLGHVMRCLALAEALIERGHACHFAVAQPDEMVRARLKTAGIVVHAVAQPDDKAAESRQIVQDVGAQGLVVDGYHFSDVWRQNFADLGLPVLAFTDGLPRQIGADLLIDAVAKPTQNPHHLFGQQFVLLRRDLVETASLPMPAMAERGSVLVTFGGSDPAELTQKVTAALTRMLPDEVAIDVVIGGATPSAANIAEAVATLSSRVTVHLAPASMGWIMRRAGLAVAAAGGTVGELAAIGVPLILAIVADNQVAGAAACAAAGWCSPIDARADPEAPRHLAEAAAALWRDIDERERRAGLARRTVDPGGAGRAAEAFVSYIERVRKI